uniref:Zinc finger CCCH domain-containing protein 3 n=1 Tax=Phallusia mammillata TaxID=59560 RepID=A0A6F9DXL8_9ASCI|nr:zinc finger CCCH domain-containing protein 3 [Phallusia mammillata]
MDESTRLKAEIAYWSDLISTHKQAQLYKARKSSFRQTQWKSNNRRTLHKTGATMGNKKTPRIGSTHSFNSNKFTNQKHSPSKYKWKPKHSSVTVTSQASTISIATAPTCASKGVLTKHKLKNSASQVPAKKKTLSTDKAQLVTKQHAQSCYKWSKTVGQTTNSFESNQLPKTACKPQGSVRSKGARSRHVWKRRRSSDSVRPKIVPTFAGNQIVTKYKLRRVHSKPRLQRQVNVSSNPYKVIKKSSSNIGIQVAVFDQRNHHMNKFANRRYKSNQYKRTLADASQRKNSKYKLVRSRGSLVNIQTRNPQSGNIVLKRKQVTAKDLFHHKLQYFYSTKQRLASQVLQKSLYTARKKNSHKLRKVFCLFYNRFGRCNRGDKCQYVHDPERVAVCTRFLRGTCRDNSCLFSHKISKKKIPVCSFFLQGKCSTKNCPYLHVFVGHSADICQPFATTGYCQKAENCKQKHIRVCPDFYNKGSCSKGNKCNLPHKSRRSKTRKSANKKHNITTTRNNNKEKQVVESDGYISLPKAKTVTTVVPDTGDQPIRTKPRLGKRKLQS